MAGLRGLPGGCPVTTDQIAMKTRMFLATAYHRGIRGLEQIMTNTIPTNGAELARLNSEIRAAITVRAHEAMQFLSATNPGAHDIARYFELARLPMGQDTSKQEDKGIAFAEGIRRLMHEKKEML